MKIYNNFDLWNINITFSQQFNFVKRRLLASGTHNFTINKSNDNNNCNICNINKQ